MKLGLGLETKLSMRMELSLVCRVCRRSYRGPQSMVTILGTNPTVRIPLAALIGKLCPCCHQLISPDMLRNRNFRRRAYRYYRKTVSL